MSFKCFFLKHEELRETSLSENSHRTYGRFLTQIDGHSKFEVTFQLLKVEKLTFAKINLAYQKCRILVLRENKLSRNLQKTANRENKSSLKLQKPAIRENKYSRNQLFAIRENKYTRKFIPAKIYPRENLYQ